MTLLRVALILLCAPVMAIAGGTLDGRIVTLNVLTWDDPASPIFESGGRTVTVGTEVEFGMGPGCHHHIDAFARSAQFAS